jgi:hypothetical protein
VGSSAHLFRHQNVLEKLTDIESSFVLSVGEIKADTISEFSLVIDASVPNPELHGSKKEWVSTPANLKVRS